MKPRASSDLSQRLHVEELELRNGLRVRLVPSASAGVASLYTFFHVGSRNERPGLTGISHLFEHMMFNGAKRYGPEQFDRVLEARGGQSNAYTSHDVTVYHEDFPADALETVLDIESDRMASLTISDAVLANEREVVREERRMRVDNEAMGLLDEEMHALAYKAHAYRWPVIGWMSDIEAISRPDCEAFFKTYYAPNNATVYLAGKFDVADAKRWFERYYADIPSGPAAAPVTTIEPPQRGARRSRVHFAAQAPLLVVAFHGPKAQHEDTLPLDVAQFAMAVGEGGRLVRELVYQRKVAISVSMDWGWRADPGLIVFYLELAPGADVGKAETALLEVLADVAKRGFSERELAKARNNLKAHLYSDLASQGGRAHALGNYEFFLGSWRAGLALADAYARVTRAQARDVVARYLLPEARSSVELVPEAA